MNDFIRSDYCLQCDGIGFVVISKEDECQELEQCEECEELHRKEVKADLLHDILKGH